MRRRALRAVHALLEGLCGDLAGGIGRGDGRRDLELRGDIGGVVPQQLDDLPLAELGEVLTAAAHVGVLRPRRLCLFSDSKNDKQSDMLPIKETRK